MGFRVVQMRIQYSENKTKQEGQSLLDQDLFTRDDKRFRYSVEHDFSKHSNLSFDLERNDMTQDRGGTNLDRVEDTYALSFFIRRKMHAHAAHPPASHYLLLLAESEIRDAQHQK